MPNISETAARVPRPAPRRRRVRGLLILVLGCVVIAGPFFAGSLALFLAGVLLIACGVLEMLETFRAPDEPSRFSAYLSGILSILVGMLLFAEPRLVLRGLALLVALSFLLDGAGKLLAAWRGYRAGSPWLWALIAGLANLGLTSVLLTGWPISGIKVVVILVGVHMVVVGSALLLRREAKTEPAPEWPPVGLHPDRRLRLPAHEEFATLGSALDAEDQSRRPIDAYWCWAFVLVFFAIHIGRMSVPLNLVGMISPLAAVVGDVGTALLLAYGLILPCRLGWRKLTRPLERRAWNRCLAAGDQGNKPGLAARLRRGWLMGRMRFSRRMARMRTSPRACFRWGLTVGLPLTAIVIALNPIWGFNWYFNSENWAAEVWNRWAEARTDTWREHMIEAVRDHYRHVPEDRLFLLEPEGISDSADFSFIVIGDTGEGDASQHCLRDQYLLLGQRPDVKFLVVSSDVIYPSGAMHDYESKFYLPFKGFTKPIYAIPGNHDWFDALEGFAANFLEEDAARASMRARVETDRRLTTTTESRIEGFIAEARRLRKEFGVRTGWQRGPFFEIQTQRFALIAADTGILRRMDPQQLAWMKAALTRAKGKFLMVILGHPLYAQGRYEAELDEDFAELHDLLRQHQAHVVMAGDTHYFEHYRETYAAGSEQRTMHHFVNGGGGAYLSIGTALDWPRKPAVPDCGFYPRTDQLIAKLDAQTPTWKMPLWLWTKHLNAWPLGAEAVAGAFDNNQAPYFQSFVEVRVEYGKNQVRFIPHGANGPLRWRDLQIFGALRPARAGDDDLVDFVVPMPQ